MSLIRIVLASALLLPAPLASALPSGERSELARCARRAPALEAMRAGAAGPVRLLEEERATLRAEQESSGTLQDLRAGAPTNEQWTWLAIGALIVLIIVLI